MATARGSKNAHLDQILITEPYRFDFFQAIRLLERIARERHETFSFGSIGLDSNPAHEVVRLRSFPSRSFPGADIVKLIQSEFDEEELVPLFEMTVSFMGLYGPDGVLPTHYTQSVIDEVRGKKRDGRRGDEQDPSRRKTPTRDFLDMFNHRIVSLFYRAWEKYRFEIGFERSRNSENKKTDVFTNSLLSSVGLGPEPLRNRLDVSDDLFLYFSGAFASHPKNATSLELVLREAFRLPIEIRQFQGQWLQLDIEQQSRMPTKEYPDGVNAQLGLNLVAGSRVWSVDSKFRIRIGPVRRAQFLKLMPGETQLVQLAQFVRQYVGPTLDFDIQLVLHREDVPEMQLSSDSPPQLGQNTWLFSKSMDEHKDEAVFRHDGWPESTH